MTKFLRCNLLLGAILVFSVQLSWGQGTTTSSMNGSVTDSNGEAVPGATVIAVHQPTNAQFGNVSDETGTYRLNNMNVGGPYTITVSFVGYETFTRAGVYLDLGQTYRLDANLSDQVTELEAIEVLAGTGEVFDGNRSAPETVVNDYAIQQLPTVSRGLNDFTRLTPLANTNIGINGAISFGGLNNRYNSIFIDGAATNDYFGLANSGTNGGQTGISPISVDGIEQFQIVLAPYDVRLGGLAGAGISAVTRSGSNELEGSAWYLVSNEGLAGKTPTDDPSVDRVKLADFSNKTYGFRLGGPIIKDKFFFFALAEIQRDETPQPFAINDYLGTATLQDFNEIGDFVRTRYNYEPGEFLNTSNLLEGEKFMVNLDYNISQKHKLSLRYRYTKADQIGPPQTTNANVFFSNSGQTFPSTANSGSLELKSNFANSSNSLLLGVTTVRDDREVTGQPFPSIIIDDGPNGAQIQLGGEPFSHANVVNQDVITLTNNFNLYRGRHTLTFGTHNELFSIFNLFLPLHPPQYSFSSIDKFLQLDDQGNQIPGATPEAYLFLYGHEQSDQNIGDDAVSVAADFNTVQLGFYAQDEFQVNENLKLTGGLRVDIPIFTTDGPENSQFDNTTRPLIEAAGYDLMGSTAGKVPSTQIHWSPRFGFNWDVTGDKTTQLRGGLGIFTSRIPYVWPGGIYLRNGLTSGFTVGFNGAGFGPVGAGGILFEPDLNNQPAITGGPQGDVDLFADDFKFPQIFKASLGVDRQLPWWGLVGTIDVQYTKKVNDIIYQHVNKPLNPIGNLTGTPDTRPIFSNAGIDPTYNYITLASNTSEGNTFSFTAQIQKPFDNGFMGSIAYSYTHAESLFDGTVFINSSQWQEYHSVNGRNNPAGLARSQFATGSRINAFVSYRKEYAKNFATSISLFFNGQSGLPFSYVYSDNDGGLNNDDPNLDEPRNLIYVPASSSEIIFGEIVDDGMGGTMVAQVSEADAMVQWNALDGFISRDDYLSERRGQYAERNGARMPFENILDLRAAQEIYITSGGRKHTLEISFDIFNFTNLLNQDWGRRYQIGDNQNFQLVNFVGFLPGTNTPTFSFADPGDPWSVIQSGVNSARWNARFGLRYSF